MRSFQRALATTVAALAFATAGITAATPAAASPEDGKGCVGTPSLPVTYVCVISVTPENVVPSTSVTNVPVTIPRLCYFLDCTAAQTVDVPVPGITPRTGVVATLWHQGKYIPINVGTSEATILLFNTINLATATVNGAAGTAGQTVAYAVTLANGAAGTAYALATSTAAAAVVTVNNAVANANATVAGLRATVDQEVVKAVAAVNAAVANVNTTLNGLVATANREVARALADAGTAVNNALLIVDREIAKAQATADNAVAAANREVANALVTVNAAISYAWNTAWSTVQYVYDVVNGLPSASQLIAFVWASIDQTLEPFRPTIEQVRETIEYYLNNPGELIRRLLEDNPTVQRVVEIVERCLQECFYIIAIA